MYRNIAGLQIKDKVIIVCMLFAGFASFLSDSINSIALYVAIPLAFLITFFDKKSLTNHSFKILIVLVIWLFLSTIWATYTDIAMRQNKQILGGVLVAYIVAKNASRKNMLPWMYSIWIALYLSAIYYANTNIIADITIGEERLNDEKLNANMLGYYTFYFTFLIYVLGEILQKVWLRKIFEILFLGTLFMSFFVAIITASRQVLIIQIPLIAFLLYDRYLKGASVKVRLLFILCTVAFVMIFREQALNIYDNSLLKVRNEIGIEDDSRTLLAKDAFKVGMNHFLWGVGNGNYVKYSYNQHFSHNTYLELFVNTGIIGFFIYLYMLIMYFNVQFKRYRYTGDKLFLMFMIFGVIYSLDNIFYVFYPYQWLIAFFILVSAHSDAYYNKKYQNVNENKNYTSQRC